MAGRGVVYSSPFTRSNEVNNVWSYTSTPCMPSWRVQAELYLFMKKIEGKRYYDP
jgi:hypothetical protein